MKGKWELVFFGYTHCPDVCPTTLNELSLAFDKLGPAARNKIGVVFITVDPDRDSSGVLKDYVSSFSAPVAALTGTCPAEIAEAAKAYRVYYAKHPTKGDDYDMDHSALIYVMDPEGRFTATFAPDDPADKIAERMQKLLSIAPSDGRLSFGSPGWRIIEARVFGTMSSLMRVRRHGYELDLTTHEPLVLAMAADRPL